MKSKERKCSASTTTGYLLSIFSSALDGVCEGGNAALTVFTSLGNTKLPIHVKATAATGVGVITGFVHSISSFCFQGSVIRKYFSPNKNAFNDKDDLDDIDVLENISRLRKILYLGLKYGYITFALAVVFFELYLLCSASKAWVNNLFTNQDVPLSHLNSWELALLILYYLISSVPFVITNEIMQSCKEIAEYFRFHPDVLPDLGFLDKLQWLIKPFAKTKFVRKFIRIMGSLTDTIEHIIPAFIIIPPSWILTLASQPWMYTIGLGSVTALALLTVTCTIFAQTYLFEGKYSEENLKNIAWESLSPEGIEEPWVSPRFAKFFHALLYLGGPLHGLGSGLTVTLALREMNVNIIFNYVGGGLAFFIAWIANHFSEVKDSQESLKKIIKSLPLAQLMSGTSSARFFSSQQVSYGTFKRKKSDDEDKQLLLHQQFVHFSI